MDTVDLVGTVRPIEGLTLRIYNPQSHHWRILIRLVWTGMNTNSPHFEQSFSDDGGRTWKVNWITDQMRVTP
jgi:hypothetical protein